MKAEKTYQNKVPRTIQQKRGGDGALEFADNRPGGILQTMSKNKINHLTQFQVPTEINQNPRPQAHVITNYTPQGTNTPLHKRIDRPKWQSGYREAFFNYKYGFNDPDSSVTDVMGYTAPIWAMEMDHIIPWSQFLQTMIDDGNYTVRDARLYYHDVDNLQVLNSRENRKKSDHDSPAYSVPDICLFFGTLPRETFDNVSNLIYDVNNVSLFMPPGLRAFVYRTYETINQIINECRDNL